MVESSRSVIDRLEVSRKDLLDLGLRNPLLNYRTPRSKGVTVVDELPREVFRILVREEKTMTFAPVPERERDGDSSATDEEWASEEGAEQAGLTEAEVQEMLSQPEDESENGGPAARHVDRHLQTTLTSQSLQRRLLNTARDARTFIEDQGVNVLYLALGMLRWFEAEASQQSHLAPLLLIPVALERSDAKHRFNLGYTGEEIEENLSLHMKMKLEFGVSIPDMGEYEDLEVEAYFDAVEKAIAGQSRWSVDWGAIHLGFFSFGKFLMYRDLDDEQWPEGDKISEHPQVNALLGEEGIESPPRLSEEEHVDDHLSLHEVRQIVDADSSQVLALLDVKSGCNLIVQGPPGTGKSQTITNMIAEAVGRGQTVLFVSEKMAALEVVKRRLDAVGLGDACLELHSRKTKKRAVLDELARTFLLGKPKLEQVEDDIEALGEMQRRLNEYCEAVNLKIGESGFTPYEAMGELVHQGKEGTGAPKLSHENMRGWTGGDFKRRQLLVEQLQSRVAQMGLPKDNPFYGTTRTTMLPTEKPELEQKLSLNRESIMWLKESGEQLAQQMGLSFPENRSSIEMLIGAARRALSAPDLRGIDATDDRWRTDAAEVETLVEAGERYTEVREQYEDTLIPEAWDEDVFEIRQRIAAHAPSWLRFTSREYREAHRQLAGFCRERPPKAPEEQLALVDAIREAQRYKEEIVRVSDVVAYTLLGNRWKMEDVDWQEIRRTSSYLTELHRKVEWGDFPKELLEFVSDGVDTEKLRSSVDTVEQDLEHHATRVGITLGKLELVSAFGAGPDTFQEKSFVEQEAVFERWKRELQRLQDMASYNLLAENLRKQGLQEILDIAESWPEAGTRLVSAFRWAWFEDLVERAFQERAALAAFDRDGHEHLMGRFRELDRLVMEHNRARLAHAHWQKLPGYSGGGQVGVLHHEIQKKRRHLPIRQLVRKAGNVMQAIKPVFMMSPLSIANYLEPGGIRFDLVIFDEASQVRPVEALGAVARGEQTVVVGDAKQLPPTSFFDSLVGSEEVDEQNVTGDLESVLGLFASKGAPQRMLRWHYRSRHESLIAVSNHEFYDNRLTIFPSPDVGRQDVGLALRHLPTTAYDRGKSHANPGEAQAVAEAVMEHARHRPGLSLGVAAFSSSQARAIEDRLEILRRKNPSCENYFSAHPFEPFFVKNLENVQGDERDVIYISVGYGRDVSGHLTMNFGPLNQDGGERRLNVLITRARSACEVFTNITADDIDLGRTEAQGVRAFKSFLRYAAEGDMEIPISSGGTDSPFEEAVLSALQSLGYRVDTQVGSAGFFIDLAVVDPERPGKYLIGIECDGATYHSARSARDRDRLRQEILEGLGWRIHRIWSTDWFRYPDRELDRVVKAIETAKLYSGESMQQNSPNDGGTTAIDRHSTVEESSEELVNTGISVYEVADIGVLPGELHQIPANRLADSVVKVIEVESPVHFEDLVRRITEAAGLSRAGSRIRRALNQAIRKAERSKQVRRSGEFLWDFQMQEVQPRDRKNVPETSKKSERIAPEEIEAAINKVLDEAFGMEREEVPSAVLRLLLDFRRTSSASNQRVSGILDSMLAEGKLREYDSQIQKV